MRTVPPKADQRVDMKIHEYQAKESLAKFGVNIPAGIPALTVEEAVEAAKQLPGPVYVVKAQIHAGGRGKGKFKELPADAKLFVDGVATETTGARRVFNTPELNQGTSFYYDLKVVNSDNTVRTTKLVVRAGEEAIARFDSSSTAGR